MKRGKAFTITLCAVFAALTAVFSWIMIPAGPVPINLALLSVLLCGGILGTKAGVMSIGGYILLGAVGIPVFAGYLGGIGHLLGPTGGYIIGYLPAVAIAGIRWGREELPSRRRLTAQMASGVFCCYCLGSIWFAVLRNAGIWDTLCLCVFPFLPGDICKIVIAVMLLPVIDRRIRKL